MARATPLLSAVALVVAGLSLGGCWADHGRYEPSPDAGPPPPPVDDAGPGCGIETTDIRITECPPPVVIPGAEVEVAVDHGVSGCCDARDGRVDVAHDGSEHTLTAQWTVCSCCDDCECVGPRQTERVSLGALEPGTHTVHAGADTCTFRVEEDATCRSISAEVVRAPAVLFPDQPVGATMRSTGSPGCGCSPRVTEALDAVEFELCGCCEECLCIDPGYEGGWTAEPHPVGEHRIFLGGQEVNVRVTERDRCRPTTPTGFTVVGPDPSLGQAGERLWWAMVQGTETVCCVDPTPAVEHRRDGNTFDLVARSCIDLDCACVGSPMEYEAAHLLGELDPGTYTVRLNGMEQTFTVP